MDDKDCYSITEFCERNSISRALLYKMWEVGTGPARIRLGSRALISREAAAEWRRSLTEVPQAKNDPWAKP